MSFLTTSFYDETFLNASQKQQEMFLRMLFAQDKVWRERFLTFTESTATVFEIKQITEINIDTLIKEIHQSMASIELEDYAMMKDYDSYSRRSYFDDVEPMYDYDALTDAIDEKLKPFRNQCLDLLKNNELFASVQVLLSLYEACFLVETPHFDEETDYNFKEIMFDFLKEMTIDWAAIASNKNIQNIDCQKVMNMIWERWNQSAHSNADEKTAIPYQNLAPLKALIVFATPTDEFRRICLNQLQAWNLLTVENHELTAALCHPLNDTELLFQCFEKYGKTNSEIGLEWLKKLLELKNRFTAVQKAQILYKYFDYYKRKPISDFLKEYLRKEDDSAFFKLFFEEYAVNYRNVEAYLKLKTAISTEECLDFIKITKERDMDFYIRLLKAEERYDDLLEYARQSAASEMKYSDGSLFWSATEPILNLFPDEMMQLYQKRILNRIDFSKKTRENYAQFIAEFRNALKIQGKQTQVNLFVNTLRSRYSKLPAFLDELKKGGFKS